MIHLQISHCLVQFGPRCEASVVVKVLLISLGLQSVVSLILELYSFAGGLMSCLNECISASVPLCMVLHDKFFRGL